MSFTGKSVLIHGKDSNLIKACLLFLVVVAVFGEFTQSTDDSTVTTVSRGRIGRRSKQTDLFSSFLSLFHTVDIVLLVTIKARSSRRWIPHLFLSIITPPPPLDRPSSAYRWCFEIPYGNSEKANFSSTEPPSTIRLLPRARQAK